MVCPGSIKQCNMKLETFIEEDTRNNIHKIMTSQSPSKLVP